MMLQTEDGGEAGMSQKQKVHLELFVTQVFIMIFHATPHVENVDIRKALVIFHLVMMTQSTLNMSCWKYMDDSVWTRTRSTCLGRQMVACSCGHLHLQKCQQNWLVLRLSAVLLLGNYLLSTT